MIDADRSLPGPAQRLLRAGGSGETVPSSGAAAQRTAMLTVPPLVTERLRRSPRASSTAIGLLDLAREPLARDLLGARRGAAPASSRVCSRAAVRQVHRPVMRAPAAPAIARERGSSAVTAPPPTAAAASRTAPAMTWQRLAFRYAARDVCNSASLAGRVADDGGIEGHEAFLARLQREHGRKYSFWQLLDAG